MAKIQFYPRSSGNEYFQIRKDSNSFSGSYRLEAIKPRLGDEDPGANN